MSNLGERIKAALSGGRSVGAVSTEGELLREDVLLALQGDVPPGPSPAAVERGRQTLLSQLSTVHSGGTNRMPFANFALSPIAAAVAGAVLLLGSFAGVSAAAGGPDVTEPVRDAVGVGDDDGDVDDVDDGGVDDVDGGDIDDADDGNVDDADDGDEDSPPSPGATPDDDDDGIDDSPDDDSPDSPEATPDDDETDDSPDDGVDNSGPGSGS